MAPRLGTGMAWFVSRRVTGPPPEAIWQDPSGRTLIVAMNVMGIMPIMIIISHAPPGRDGERAEYFANVMQRYGTVRTAAGRTLPRPALSFLSLRAVVCVAGTLRSPTAREHSVSLSAWTLLVNFRNYHLNYQ